MKAGWPCGLAIALLCQASLAEQLRHEQPYVKSAGPSAGPWEEDGCTQAMVPQGQGLTSPHPGFHGGARSAPSLGRE